MGINTDFAQILDQVAPRLRAITNWTEPFGPDKWTRIELLGHLLDSAANNHQRFVRALSQASSNGRGTTKMPTSKYKLLRGPILITLLI